MSILDKCRLYDEPDRIKRAGIYPYFRAVEESEGPVVKMEGRHVIMAGSNNYCGLTTHPHVKEKAIKALEKYGSSCSGSRFLTGTIDLHIELEHKLAQFMGKESALLFSTGYQSGQGVIAPLVTRGEYVLSDKDNHASIVAGNLMVASTGVKVVRYRHNDMDDLAKKLDRLPLEAGKLIATDGVFSTFGTIVDLPRLNKLAKQYNATVLVDDAHALGVIGEGGRGTASDFGLVNDIDMVVCTFSKTLASLGGFVVGDAPVVNYLKHKSPALIFSASPTPSSVAAAYAALEVLIEHPELANKVRYNAQKIRSGLQEMGYNVPDGRTAIVPIIIGDNDATFTAWKMLYDAGVFVNAFVSPATPPGKQMLRTSYMASHEDHHLDKMLDIFEKVGRKLGITSKVV